MLISQSIHSIHIFLLFSDVFDAFESAFLRNVFESLRIIPVKNRDMYFPKIL